ncbi:MAG: ice-binding family protein [Planctomycetota bacterium]
MNRSLSLSTLLAFSLSAFAVSCSDDDNDTGGQVIAPSVTSTTPVSDATSVPVNARPTVRFSENMNASTLTGSSFLVTTVPGGTALPGNIVHNNSTTTFWPTTALPSNSTFRATVTRDAQNTLGVGLPADYTWDFTTGDQVEPGVVVPLGTAGDYVLLAKSGISTVPTSTITGDVGLSPAAATFVTGFGLTLDPSGTFSTSPQVAGNVYAADYDVPTPAALTTAVLGMEAAYTNAAGRFADVTELGGGNIGGRNLAAGVYKWSTGVQISDDLTLTGGPTDVWVFQIAQNLLLATATNVTLAGGALPRNVFWQVGGGVELGSSSRIAGILLSSTTIALQTGAVVNGRLMAGTAINMDNATITQPAQ